MKDSTCRNFANFCQHYAFWEGRIFRVACGHCMDRKIKSTNPDTKACKQFLSGPSVEEQFVTKQYLSKRLLEHILSLDLLPAIEDASPEIRLKEEGS